VTLIVAKEVKKKENGFLVRYIVFYLTSLGP
jgi:hypothetical protein